MRVQEKMFQVTTLDLANTPVDDQGKIDYSKDFFGEMHLTVSGQLNCETFAQAFRNVYTFLGPTFRAENSNITC